MRWVNFKEVKEKVSIKDVLIHYEAKGLKESNGKLIGPCPVHGGNSPTAFHVDLEKNIWHCFTGCRRGGNVLDLVACRENISIRDAALKLQDLFLSEEDNSSQIEGNKSAASPVEQEKQPAGSNPSSSKKPKLQNPALPFTLNLAPDHPYLLKERGLDSKTIEHFGLGYCLKGMLKGKIAIPIHDQEGQLVAYVGRTIKEGRADPTRPKYKFPKGFHKQLVLYNLHYAQRVASETGELILVEGFFDAFHLHQAGYENVVALMGSAMSLEQEALLRAHSSSVTLFLDGDESGRDCAEECLWRLVNDLHVRLIDLEEGEQPDNLSQERIQKLLG